MITETLKKFVHFPKIVQKRVWFLWTCYLLFQIGFLFVWILTSTLFLKLFSVHNIPYLFVLEGVGILAGSLLTKYYFLKTKTNNFLKATLSVILALILVSVFFQETSFAIFGIALVAKSLVYPQVQLGLFKKIESFFNPNQARKAIPFIETAETIGLIVGSVMALGILQISNDLFALFYWWAVPLVALFLLLKKEARFIKKIKHLPIVETSKKFISDKSLFANGQKSFVLGLLLLVGMQAAVFTTLEISFLHEVESHHEVIETGTKISLESLQANSFDITKMVAGIEKKVVQTAGKTIAHELGLFALISGFIALFFKIVVTPSVIKKWGIFGSIFSYFTFFLTGVLAFVFGKTSAEMLKGIQHGTYSFFASPYHLSFYAYNQKIRERLRHLLHGIIWPLGSVLAAGLLWFISMPKITLLVLVIGLLAVSFYLRKKFPAFSFANFKAAEDTEEKLHILEMLERFEKTPVAQNLAAELLKKNQPFILRKKIVEALIELKDSSVVHQYLQILTDPNESHELKILILEALYEDKNLKKYCANKAFTENKLFETWQNLFALTSNSHLKKLVVMNIFKHISNEKTVSFLRDVLASGDEHLLAICLRSCAQFSDPEIVSEILPLLEHESSRIRSHVIMAIWKFSPDKSRLKKMLRSMLQSDVLEERISGVYAIGELQLKEFVPQIEKKLRAKVSPLKIHCLMALLKLEQKNYVKSLTKIITGSDESLANMAFYMRKRLPKNIQEKLEAAVFKQVSAQVDLVLRSNKNLHKISDEKISYFRRLFLFSEQYESLLLLDKVG